MSLAWVEWWISVSCKLKSSIKWTWGFSVATPNEDVWKHYRKRSFNVQLNALDAVKAVLQTQLLKQAFCTYISLFTNASSPRYRLIYQQNGNVSWRRCVQIKQLAWPMAERQIWHRKSSFPRAFPSSTEVPVLLLNQPIFWGEGQGDVYTQAIHTFMRFCYSSVYVSYSLYSFKIAIGLKDTSVIQIFVTIPLP